MHDKIIHDFVRLTLSVRLNGPLDISFKQLSKYVTKEILKKFYQGYILSLIDYGSLTLGSTSSCNLERLSKLQRRAARIILQAEYNTPSKDMFRELEGLSICERLKYNKGV